MVAPITTPFCESATGMFSLPGDSVEDLPMPVPMEAQPNKYISDMVLKR